ncbi:MAG TPA: 5-formyltetrahydrofolate cyclo-ligase [Tepidisphaeraceae bacterium]|jgi:5-formyltetrahydrofolate cyclo-ligase
MAETSSILAGRKAALRRDAVARRDTLAPQERERAALAVAAATAFPVAVAPATVVSGFSPIRSELSPLPLMRRLGLRGACLALPAIAGRGQPLTMRAWAFGAPIKAGVWGIREPHPDAEEVFPDIVIVPLLAFDRHGGRLGYGGGFYDRTLRRLRDLKSVTAIGLAFAVQQIAEVPTGPGDERLDLVLTEGGTFDFRT